MRIIKQLVWAIFLLVVQIGAPLAADQAIQPTEAIELFNGRDLDNFYTWVVDQHYDDPNRVFTVVDQIDGAPAIRVSGENWGGFTTRESYRNYRLVVEFRWGPVTWGSRRNSTRDSGILVHCQGRDGNTGESFNGPWMSSVETQIIEGGVADFILVGGHADSGERIGPTARATVKEDRDGEPFWDPEGELREFTRGRVNWFGRDPEWQDVLGFRGKHDLESPYGEWTRIEVIAEGSKVTNFVNGIRVNALIDSSFTQGKIQFQSEGAEIYFRRIELHPLP